MPIDVRRIVEPYGLVGDITIIGFYFIGGSVFLEKQERTLGAHPKPERNATCPCGSGRKFKRCVHRWGEAGIPLCS